MNWNAISRRRFRLTSALLGLTLPGMGQIRNGELLKGLCVFALFVMALVFGLRLAVRLPDERLLSGVLAVLAAMLLIYLGAVAEAWVRAGREEALSPRPYNRWYVYLTLWLALWVGVFGTVLDYTRARILEPYRIPSASMEPTVVVGDMILADKTYYERHSPQVGDIVIFTHQDDRSRVFMKRIAGLPGETVTLPDGAQETVPHGQVYVLGDNIDDSTDSRVFGAIPLRDLMGRMRQIYFSLGPDGIRWDRVGLVPGEAR